MQHLYPNRRSSDLGRTPSSTRPSARFLGSAIFSTLPFGPTRSTSGSSGVTSIVTIRLRPLSRARLLAAPDRNRHLVSHASVLNRARPGPKVFAQAKPGFLKPLPPVCDDRHGAFGQTGVARGKSAPDVPRRWIAARQPVHVGEAAGVEHDRRRPEIAGSVAKAAASVFRPFMRQQIG